MIALGFTERSLIPASVWAGNGCCCPATMLYLIETGKRGTSQELMEIDWANPKVDGIYQRLEHKYYWTFIAGIVAGFDHTKLPEGIRTEEALKHAEAGYIIGKLVREYTRCYASFF